MQPSICVLSTISSDLSHPSVLLQMRDGKRYILGRVGAGFQRTLSEHKVRSGKLQGVFLSGDLAWKSLSGLPGYLISLGDSVGPSGRRVITALPKRAQKLIDSWKQFVTHQPLDVVVSGDTFSDENIEIEPVLLGGNATSFIVQLMPIRGKFDIRRAIELGVPKGPLFGALSKGETITLENGKIIYPTDVLGPAPTPSRFLVLDLPSKAHVAAARDYNWWAARKRRRNDAEYDVAIRAVYLLLADEIEPNSPEIADLVAQFGPDCHTYISHRSIHADVSTQHSFVNFQASLRAEFPAHFSKFYAKRASQELKIPGAQPMQQLHVLGLVSPFPEVYTMPNQPVVDCEGEQPGQLTELEVVTLGTGASLPSKFRNVSSTLVRAPTDQGIKSIIFDCGEGTLGTLSRIYGPKGRDERLRELNLFYVSHMHADHHLGTLELLQQWQIANKDGTLHVFGPKGLFDFLEEVNDIDNAKLDKSRFKFVDNESLIFGKGYGTESHERPHFERNSLRIETCRAIHCQHSYSTTVTIPTFGGSSLKVSYSGDTRPNMFFARTIGRNSDLLIHEATHDDELAAEASAKRHSTISEAVGVAREMRARNTILTHISQRYPLLPTIANALESGAGPTCFGFDGMHTFLSSMVELQHAVPRLGEIFAEAASSEGEE